MYEEFSNISAPVSVSGNSKLNLNPDAAAESWIDGLIATGAEVLATYEHPRFADFAAVTSKASGIGRVTLVGCVPNLSLASSIISWASPVAASNELVEGAQLPVYVASGATTKGKRVSFAFNWGWQPQELTLAVKALDPISGESLEAGKKILLTGWSTRILVSQ
jgi:beta-galactosidase